ncbi:MAG: TIGR02646 family protein [Lachnospiraceae bacterium]|nr:TIGR02646 family protein [Lachnospiraceae bacterium]
MKRINKGDSPEWFEAWKQDFKSENGREAHYKNDFSTNDRDGKMRRQRLRKQLIKEQGNICCYCMKRVFLNNSHIEHFWPKTFFPQIDLEYKNMFASCNGEGITDSDGHCGHKKEDWWDEEMISPAKTEVERMFKYSIDGKIHSVPRKPTTNIAQKMITQMGLDNYHLIRNRRNAIESSEVYDEERYSDENIRDFIDYYSNKDNDSYIPYCMAIVDCLRDCLSE